MLESHRKGAPCVKQGAPLHDRAPLERLSIADTGGIGLSDNGLREPVAVLDLDSAYYAAEGTFRRPWRDSERILRNILADHTVCLCGRHCHPFAERIKKSSVMPPDDFPVFIQHFAFLLLDVMRKEFLHVHFADEAEALAVLLVGSDESELFGEP